MSIAKPSLPPPSPLRADRSIAIGRQHVESEQSLASVRGFPSEPFVIPGFSDGRLATAQWLSGDRSTGASTQRVTVKAGWRAPIGHFDHDVELFVLQGKAMQGGFALRKLTYAFVPAGMVVGPWLAEEDTILLWMPDAAVRYETAAYASLPSIPENALYHRTTQTHPRMREYKPAAELNAMKWEGTTFLPPGSARKSLHTDPQTGRATWVLGLVPMWIEGNFFAGHPTAEEAYVISGDVQGHWSMQDDPFNRRYAAMERDGYYWRPAHVPHGPFWSETGALLLFRTECKLDCYWLLHTEDIEQRTTAPAPRTFGGNERGTP